MAALVLDRVIETTTTNGTGTLNLSGAATGYNAFRDEAADGAAVYYKIVDSPSAPTAWEYGIGTLTYGTPDTLSRDEVIDSSNAGSKISLAAETTYTVNSPFGKDAAQPGSVAKTSAYTLTTGDIGKFISCDASSAGFTVTLPAAATATGRYWALIANAGTSNDVTVDPDGSEKINGAATITLEPGGSALLRCDGSNWTAVVAYPVASQSDSETGTSSTTLLTPQRGLQLLGANESCNLVLDGTLTSVSSVSIDLPAGYKGFVVRLARVVPVTSGANLYVRRIQTDNTTVDSGSADYQWAQVRRAVGGSLASADDGGSRQAQIEVATNLGNNNYDQLAGEIRLNNIDLSSSPFSISATTEHVNGSGNFQFTQTHGRRFSTTASGGIYFSLSSGNFANFDYRVYGLR